MKTIEDLKISLIAEFGSENEDLIRAVSNISIEFSQRWISVNEEFPEIHITILIKRDKPFHLYNTTGFMGYKNIFYSNETAIVLEKVTHWRPIELK